MIISLLMAQARLKRFEESSALKKKVFFIAKQIFVF
jgi:hypothetical protein